MDILKKCKEILNNIHSRFTVKITNFNPTSQFDRLEILSDDLFVDRLLSFFVFEIPSPYAKKMNLISFV